VNDNPRFTPGPWRQELPEPGFRFAQNGDRMIYAGDGMIIAMVIHDGPPDARPNANLIAAAPELYDLVKEMLGCLDEVMVERHDSGGLAALGITHDDEGCSLCKARRVLAKAEGRS
jgi:hypothetical protein